MRSTILTPADAAIVIGICFGDAILLSVRAVRSGFPVTPFTDGGALWGIGAEVVLATAALLFLHARQFDVVTLLPVPTVRGTVAGLGWFLAAWLCGIAVTLPFAAAQPAQPIEQMVAEATLTLPLIVAFAIINGTFEEVFLLGVLTRGLRRHGLSLAIGLPLLVRVSYHLYQGPVGAVWILTFGLLFALLYVRTGSLWPPVFAHILWDIVPFVVN